MYVIGLEMVQQCQQNNSPTAERNVGSIECTAPLRETKAQLRDGTIQGRGQGNDDYNDDDDDLGIGTVTG